MRRRVRARAGDDRRAVADRADGDPDSSNRSSSESVGDSPVVPATTMPSEPFSTRWWASSAKRWKSTEPSSRNGVTIAVRTAPSIVSDDTSAVDRFVLVSEQAGAVRERRVAEQAALGQPVFSIADRAYTWRDIVAYARLLGIWDEIEEGAARAASAEQAAPDPEAIDEAAMTFRRERGLLAADELAAWLDRRSITVDDWLAYVRRSLLGHSVEQHAPTSDEVWAEAMCSGRLDELADELADRLAVAPGSQLRGAGGGVRRLLVAGRDGRCHRPRDCLGPGRVDPCALSSGAVRRCRRGVGGGACRTCGR